MKIILWCIGLMAVAMAGKAAICDFPTCIVWYKNGQCAQTTCDPCVHFMCLSWHENGQCLTGTCTPTCMRPQCHKWHENGQCLRADC